MIVAGCDLGILSAKAAVIDYSSVHDNIEILSAEILPYRSHPKEAAQKVMDMALANAKLSFDQVSSFVATGFGAKAVPFETTVIPPMLCLHRAIRMLNKNIRTVVDVGGHSFTAFHVNDEGDISESTITDKCASGTGKFIETIVNTLEMPLEELCRAALDSKKPLPVTNQCVILAESDVISHINAGHDRVDIFAGITSYVASNIVGLMNSIDIIEDVAMTGGVAKNCAVVKAIETRLGYKLADTGTIDPQLFGAIGAAIMAQTIQHNATGD